MSDNPTRIFVAMPVHAAIDPNTVMSLLQLQRLRVPIAFMIYPSSWLPTGRAVLAEAFMRSGASHLLFVDSDMRFAPPVVERLLAADRDMIGCAYRHKTGKPDVVSFVADPSGGGVVKSADGIVEVHGIGFGLVLIKRRVIELMQASYAELRHAIPEAPMGIDQATRLFDPLYVSDASVFGMGGGALQEDLSFCVRWQEIGGKVHMLLDADIGHVGTFVYEGNLARNIEQRASAAAAAAE